MIRRISKLVFPAVLWWAAVQCFGSVAYGQEAIQSSPSPPAVLPEPSFSLETDGSSPEIDNRLFDDSATDDGTIVFESLPPVDPTADSFTDRGEISLELPPSTVVSPRSSYEQKQSDEMYERVLDLEPNAQNRA